jgi:urease accessory protein
MSAASLRLLQLVSPALPVGGFSYSEGLEVLVQAGRLADGAAVARWLEAELASGSLTLEAAALPCLFEQLGRWRQVGGEEAERLAVGIQARDGWLQALREAPQLRAQQRQMGLSLLQLLADLGWPLPFPLAWTGAWAWAGLVLELEKAAVVEGYLYGWVANQLSAAVRLVPLGPTEAQRLQLGLAPAIAERAAALLAADPDQLWSSGVGAAMAQLGHGELYSRLFRS